MRAVFGLVFFLSMNTMAAQQSDREFIKSLAGCYRVVYQYQETFPLQSGYKLQAPERVGSTEVVLLDLDQNNKIELQHVLVAGGEAQKHWRENWEFEPQYYFEFVGQNTWVKKAVLNSSGGQWVQRTLQVDDSPRYECVSPIVSTLNNAFWECRTWAPLPRRELKRRDYNVLDRRNRIQHTATGWLHEEDNTKLLVTGDQQTGIVKEKGENVYTKIDAAACAQATQYWTQNKYIWDAIRSVWEELYAERQVLKFDGGGLWMKLFELADVAAEKKLSTADIKTEARAAILSYLK